MTTIKYDEHCKIKVAQQQYVQLYYFLAFILLNFFLHIFHLSITQLVRVKSNDNNRWKISKNNGSSWGPNSLMLIRWEMMTELLWLMSKQKKSLSTLFFCGYFFKIISNYLKLKDEEKKLEVFPYIVLNTVV